MRQPADLIITNARAITLDPANPNAAAVVIHGRRIGFVGGAAEAQRWRGPRTRVIDAMGRTLLPGFIDSHYHLLAGSLQLADMQLAATSSHADLAQAIHEFAAANPDRAWLAGYGLRYNLLPGGQSFDRQLLDAIVADRPLVLFAYDLHTAWANTRALELAGLLRGGDCGANSEILIGSDGLAAGELREQGAYQPILALLPHPDGAQRRALLHQGLNQAARLGITSIHNMDGDTEQLALYAALEDLGELTLRVYCAYDVKPATPLEALAEAAALRDAHQSAMVRAGCVKFFMDGVVESYTALLLDAYADRPDYYGDANFSAEHFNRMATEADRLGLQIFVHAIGDAAVRRTLDGFAAARQANDPMAQRAPGRHRVEHIELVHPEDLPRFAALGVVASMQPLHAPAAAGPGEPWPLRVGPQRWDRSFAWQSVREAGATLVFGSDWPVVSQNPLLGIHAALTRRPWNPGQPAQAQTLLDTLASYTHDAAYAEFQEHAKGQLRAGMLADLALLSDDIAAAPPEAIAAMQVMLTVCDGRVVYEA